MEREDPLEKFERLHQQKDPNRGYKITIGVMAAVVLALAVLFVITKRNHANLENELTLEKKELADSLMTLQASYDTLSSDYENINLQLDSSRMEVALLIEKVNRTSASDRREIRKYQKELGTLRTILRSYIVQIDSLNTLNHKLTNEAASARKEAATVRSQNQELTARVEDLSGKIATGAVVKGRGVSVDVFGENDKITDKSNKVSRLRVNLSLVENPLAEKGPLRVYVRVTDPDGNLLEDGHGTTFDYNGATLKASASREIDYEGNDIELGIYVNNIPEYTKGIYTVQAYTSASLLGSSEFMLR